LAQAVSAQSQQDYWCVYGQPPPKGAGRSGLCTQAMDWMPILSQSKSLVQALAGDVEGALRTQVSFTRSCPLISQIRSLGEVYMGRFNDAQQTQLESYMVLSRILDSIPVVGHMKGLMHYVCDDADGCAGAVRSATRTVGVVGCASCGMLLLGPAGGVLGGTCGGVFMDMLITTESFIKGEPVPYGYIAMGYKIRFYPGCKRSGPTFDLCAVAALDAFAGFGAASGLTGFSHHAPAVTTHHAVANPSVVSSKTGVTTCAVANLISTFYSVSGHKEGMCVKTNARVLLQKVGRRICLASRVVRAMDAQRELHGESHDTSLQRFINQHAKSVQEQQLLNAVILLLLLQSQEALADQPLLESTCRLQAEQLRIHRKLVFH